MSEHQFSNAEQDDLWRHLQEAAEEDGSLSDDDGLSLKVIMESWTEQPNYPLLTVTSTTEQRLNLTQVRERAQTHN